MQGSMDRGRLRLSPQSRQIYALAFEPARRMCVGDLRARGTSRDLAEEIFSRALTNVMSNVDPVARDFSLAELVSYLKVACRNCLIDEVRHNKPIARVGLDELPSLSDPTIAQPEEDVLDREEARSARAAIRSLPERQFYVFTQRYVLGRTPAAIVRSKPGLTARSYRKLIEKANARLRNAV